MIRYTVVPACGSGLHFVVAEHGFDALQTICVCGGERAEDNAHRIADLLNAQEKSPWIGPIGKGQGVVNKTPQEGDGAC